MESIREPNRLGAGALRGAVYSRNGCLKPRITWCKRVSQDLLSEEYEHTPAVSKE
jgi:hypothetical protein